MTEDPATESDFTQTLNDLLTSAAAEWSTEHRLKLVEALRTQRERWNQEQASGSKKRVTSKQINAPKQGKKKLALDGLKI
jgi:hypothetical protein